MSTTTSIIHRPFFTSRNSTCTANLKFKFEIENVNEGINTNNGGHVPASRKRARPKLTIRSNSITQNHRNHDVQTSSIILLLLWSRSSITICASIYYHCSTVDSITIVAMSLHSCSQQQRFRTSAVPSTSHHFSPSEASLRNKP